MGKEKKPFIFANLSLKVSVSFNYDCKQNLTVALEAPVTLSLMELTDTFISH